MKNSIYVTLVCESFNNLSNFDDGKIRKLVKFFYSGTEKFYPIKIGAPS